MNLRNIKNSYARLLKSTEGRKNIKIPTLIVLLAKRRTFPGTYGIILTKLPCRVFFKSVSILKIPQLFLIYYYFCTY